MLHDQFQHKKGARLEERTLDSLDARLEWKTYIADTIVAHFESNYSPYYSNYSTIRTSIVATIVILEINGGPEHRYSSRSSGSLL